MAIRREGDRGMGRWGEKISSVVSLKLLYNDKKGCHSRENGNPAEKTGFRIKSGMTFCVKSFLRQYARVLP
jgi:hypothetical protein